MMKTALARLHEYPFQRLASLMAGIQAPAHLSPVSLSIGEPRHPPPEFVLQVLQETSQEFSRYPATKGLPELRLAIAHWLENRFNLPELDPEQQILPLAGTREGLFSIAQCLLDPQSNALVMLPNPFYQIYEGASLLAGGEPRFLNCSEQQGFLPVLDDITPAEWQRCKLFYVCSPGNPTGAVCPLEYFKKLINLAERHDFVLVSDECYSEIYFGNEKPPGLLQACLELGNTSYRRCLVMNSLSKRSNLAGLRSGFVAGDASLLESYLLYRTYHGSTLPIPIQHASVAAWQDEAHVAVNRELYQKKFATFRETLQPFWSLKQPEAGFFFWAETPIDDQQFARELYEQQNIKVLPGSFLGRDHNGINPGQEHVRMALVARPEECEEAARRLVSFLQKF